MNIQRDWLINLLMNKNKLDSFFFKKIMRKKSFFLSKLKAGNKDIKANYWITKKQANKQAKNTNNLEDSYPIRQRCINTLCRGMNSQVNNKISTCTNSLLFLHSWILFNPLCSYVFLATIYVERVFRPGFS